MADSIKISLNTAVFNARLSQYIQATGRDADEVTLQVAQNVLSDTVENWPVAAIDGGASRAAWWGPNRLAPAAYQIGNPLVYSAVIEYGGYPGVGPKTVQFGGETLPGGQSINAGIYPSQVPAAPLRRALAANYQRLTQGLKRALGEAWRR